MKDLLIRDRPDRLRILMVRRRGSTWSVISRPLWEFRIAEDAIVHYDVPGGVKKPWPEMKQWLPGGLQLFRVTQHNMSNPLVEFAGDRASSTTYGHLIHVQQHKDGSSTVMRHHTIYRDEWVRSAEGWQIRSRTLSNLYMDGPVFGPDRVELYPSPEPY